MGASASGGTQALLGRATMAGLQTEDDDREADHRQLELKAGYGFGIYQDQFILTPGLGLARSPQHREYRLGARLDRASRGSGAMELDFRIRRRESIDVARVPEHEIRLQLQVRF